MKFIKIIFSLFVGLALSWPILFTPLSAMQTPAQAQNIEVINAWYGDDTKNAQATYATSASVVPKLREIVNKYGFIAIPAQMHTFYGFDPLPNVQKKTAIHIRSNGKEEHLRAEEGKDFIFPSTTDPVKVQQALSELKNTLVATPTQKAAPGVPPTDAEKLKTAIFVGDFTLAKNLIEKGAHIGAERPPLTLIHMPSGQNLEDTATKRLEFAKYLIEKGHDVNQTNQRGWGPLELVAGRIADPHGYISDNLINNFFGPLMELYINENASIKQIERAREVLIKGGCITTYPCPMSCPPCVRFYDYWHDKIEPLIQEKTKIYKAVSQDVQNAVTNNDITTLKQLIDQNKITANRVIELATQAKKYTIVQAIAQYIEQKK